MKTVPTVHVSAQADTTDLPDLTDEIRLGLGDIAGAAREGLLAMGVAAGLAVMQTMFEAETPRWPGRRASTMPNAPRYAMAAGRAR